MNGGGAVVVAGCLFQTRRGVNRSRRWAGHWIPAFAGMTVVVNTT